MKKASPSALALTLAMAQAGSAVTHQSVGLTGTHSTQTCQIISGEERCQFSEGDLGNANNHSPNPDTDTYANNTYRNPPPMPEAASLIGSLLLGLAWIIRRKQKLTNR